jgi:pantothenate kinase
MDLVGTPSASSAGQVVLGDLDAAVRRARSLSAQDGRRVLGITGSPGSGKTTLAVALVEALNTPASDGGARGPEWACHVPMDGFHLADVELARLGRLDRKGAADTFDACGYAALLRRIRTAESPRGSDPGETVYAPAFDRRIEQPIAGAIPVPAACRLVVTEGNYLLLEDSAWRDARAAIDEIWFCDLDDGERRRRLVERHVAFGKSRHEAEAWVARVDEPNAAAIAANRAAADVIVTAAVTDGAHSC